MCICCPNQVSCHGLLFKENKNLTYIEAVEYMSHGFGFNSLKKNKQRVYSQLTFWCMTQGKKIKIFLYYVEKYLPLHPPLFYLPLPLSPVLLLTKILSSILPFCWAVFTSRNLSKLFKTVFGVSGTGASKSSGTSCQSSSICSISAQVQTQAPELNI